MTQIQPVVFPLNLGTATKIAINLIANPNQTGATISYALFEAADTPKMLGNGSYGVTEEDYVAHGNDKEWIINYVVQQLGVTIVQE